MVIKWNETEPKIMKVSIISEMEKRIFKPNHYDSFEAKGIRSFFEKEKYVFKQN